MARSWFNVCLITALSLPVAARADIIYGVLNTSGTADISTGNITFVNTIADATGQTGGFASGGIPGSAVTIEPVTNVPPVGARDVTDWLTISVDPDISFTLTFLFPGNFTVADCLVQPPSPGQTCTPGPPFANPSPFDLINTANGGSTASFDIAGIETSLSEPGVVANVKGTFTTQFNFPYQTLLAEVLQGETVPADSVSATFTVTPAVPEPGTLISAMIGTGLLGIGLYRRKSLELRRRTY